MYSFISSKRQPNIMHGHQPENFNTEALLSQPLTRQSNATIYLHVELSVCVLNEMNVMTLMRWTQHLPDMCC